MPPKKKPTLETSNGIDGKSFLFSESVLGSKMVDRESLHQLKIILASSNDEFVREMIDHSILPWPLLPLCPRPPRSHLSALKFWKQLWRSHGPRMLLDCGISEANRSNKSSVRFALYATFLALPILSVGLVELYRISLAPAT